MAHDIPTPRWTRHAVAEKLAEFEAQHEKSPFLSQRQLAAELQIPRTTLQHWLARKARIDAHPDVVAFFESSAGLAFLHRCVLAAHFVMSLLGPCGTRAVCTFLELSRLDQFVVASYGAHYKIAVTIEEAIESFDQEEKLRLAHDMEPKQIAVCEDETYHPAPCLVAIEPVSNFILVEQYAEDRAAATWTQAVHEATATLPLEIIQSTSDEARGILHHVQDDLGIHHSPDLFHVQQELVKGTSGALASKVRQAAKAVEHAEATAHTRAPLRTGASAVPDLDVSSKPVETARGLLHTATAHQEQAHNAIQGIRGDYHPYDLDTGAVRRSETVSASLARHMAALEDVAKQADLSEKCCDRIAKAKRLVVHMVATIAFFFLTITAKVEALSLGGEAEEAVFQHLIPALYLQRVADKTTDRDRRQRLHTTSQALLAPLRDRDGPFRELGQEDLQTLEQVARECADVFQRSSSCVEGRNGQLALRHHSLHRLSNRKLKALTGVHNYFVQRTNGTTAAERFFGAKPRDLFQWLLDRVDIPSRPAQKRAQPKPHVSLGLAAA